MNKLTQGQVNTAACEMRDFCDETNTPLEHFANYFYDVAVALGYESDNFVEFMEKKFPEECKEVILRIKVIEGW